jgi:phage shock protein PspC (stress-responsive transcriptional regulator)
MKKTINIHISRQPFTIEEEAYDKLSIWLDAVRKEIDSEPGSDEIMQDIEMRAAELLGEYTANGAEVITYEQVEQLISVMGTPEDFVTEDDSASKKEPFKSDGDRRTTRRLYRDISDRILGGVAGGMGKYFSVDPIIFRLLFVLFTFVGGAGPIVYLLLWALVPVAKTRAQKLEMRGKRVTVDNLGRMVNEEFREVKQNLSEGPYSRQFNKATDGLREILLLVFKVLLFVVGFSFFIGGIIGLIFTLSAFFSDQMIFFVSNIPGFVSIQSFFELFADAATANWFLISLLVVAGLPLLLLIYVGSKILFRYKANDRLFFIGGFALFFAAVIISGFFGLKIFGKYKTETQHTYRVPVEAALGDTLILSMQDISDSDFMSADFDLDRYKVSLADDTIKNIYGLPRLDIRQSDNENSFLEYDYSIHGVKFKSPKASESHIQYDWTQEGNRLRFMPYFTTQENKLYFEELRLRLNIPSGTYVYLEPDLKDIIWNIQNEQNMWDSEMLGKTWYMNEDGLLSLDSTSVDNQK